MTNEKKPPPASPATGIARRRPPHSSLSFAFFRLISHCRLPLAV
jgi:hypothetical protein